MSKRIFITPTKLEDLVNSLRLIWPDDSNLILDTTVNVDEYYDLLVVPSSELDGFLSSKYKDSQFILVQENEGELVSRFEELRDTNLKQIVRKDIEPRKLLQKMIDIISEQEQSSTSDGKLVKVVSLNGGVGKSFISLNLAYHVAQVNSDVVFFDNSYPFGVLNSFLKIEPDFNIDSIRPILGEDVPTSTQLQNILTSTDYNFSAIANNFNGFDNSPLNYNQYTNLIIALKKKFNYIIEDSSTLISSLDFENLKGADLIIFVLNPNVMNAFNFKSFLQVLKSNNFLYSKSMIIMNKYQSYGKTKTNLKDFNNYLGLNINYKVEDDSQAVYKYDEKDLIFTNSKLVVYNDIKNLAEFILSKI